MGLHAAIIRLSPLINEGEQRYKRYIFGDPWMVTPPLKNPGYPPETKITNGNMYAVHVVNRPLTKNYKQLLDEVFVTTRISKGKENVIGFS